MNFEIARLDEAFVAGVAEIEKVCFSTPWSEDGIRSEISNPNARFFVAVSSGTVIGYAGMHIVCGECYIANVAVLPEYRQSGVASALLMKLEETAVSENGEFITLEVRQSNDKAIRLYSKHGYSQVGIRKNYYSRPTEDAVLMTKITEV